MVLLYNPQMCVCTKHVLIFNPIVKLHQLFLNILLSDDEIT